MKNNINFKIKKFKGDNMLIKYPRTFHLPYSLGMSSDDKVLNSDYCFNRKTVVVTEKMDGENTTISFDRIYARSVDSKHEWYHSWLLNWSQQFIYLLDKDIRICGEYLYCKHSIEYENLESYFLGFSVWKKDVCLSWDKTIKFFNNLGIKSVPIIWIGQYDSEYIKSLADNTVNKGGEGIVVRVFDEFKYKDFSSCVAKYVRANHVQTNIHWKNSTIELNKLIEKYVNTSVS